MKALTDMELRVAGFDVLAKVLGILDAERFIALTIREPMDYTSWREKHMYLDDDIEAVAARAKAAAKEFDAMNGDYTRLQEGVFDDDVASELDGKISAWKSAIGLWLSARKRKMRSFFMHRNPTAANPERKEDEGGMRKFLQAMTMAAVVTMNVQAATHAKVQLWEGGPYWATTNIGANNPWNYGLYFWWGDTIGHTASSGFSFSAVNTLTYNKSITTLKSEGWVTSDGILALEHDAAHIQWGGRWRMPTYQELYDLVYKCSWKWTKMNGVNGYIVSGRDTYASASIFLPCPGYAYATQVSYTGGYYWSSVPNDYNSLSYTPYNETCNLCFRSGDRFMTRMSRENGFSIRPVQDFGIEPIVSFNANGGTGTMESQAFEECKEQKLSKNTYTKDGYVFQGWAETKADADNGFVKYRDEALITVDHDMTLYAVWANPALTLTAESADWSSGSITLCCTDVDMSGEKHKYTLQCFHDDVSKWVDVGDDRAIDVSPSADGKAHLTDGFFAERFDGIPPVKYRVRDKHNRVSAECVTRSKYGIFVGLSHYSPSYQTYLIENSGSPLTEDEHGRNAAYASSLCELAKTNGQLDSNNCFLLQDSLATYSNVSAAFNTILNDRKIKPGDICMLYFATHGTAKSSTTTGGIYLYDKPNLDGADFYQEELLSNHIKSLDPTEKGVAVVGILSACHSGAFIDSSAEQVCQYGWCQDQGLSDINVAWITAADVNSVSYGIFSDFLINYGWNNGWAWKKSGRAQDDKVVSFYDLAGYAINQFQPIAARREISGGKIKNDAMLKNIIAGTSIAPSSSLNAPGNPINVKASPEVPNAESPNKVVVTWEQGTGGTPSEYYVIRRRKNTGEYLATLIGTKDRKIDAEDAATRDNPMQYYVVAVNGAGVAVSENPAEGWRSDVFLVELDVDGGTLPLGTETPMSVSVSSPTIQNLPTPDKYGYEFSGWFWDSEYTRAVILGSQISRDVVIHAKWIGIPRYTVTFKYALPGISYVSPPKIVYPNFMRGTKLGDKVISDTKSIAEEAINKHEIRNYAFKGWFSEQYGRGLQATKDTVIVNDAEYFAYWEWNGSEPPMPQVWLDSHSAFAAASNGETLRAAAMTAANGCRTVAECYALGIDPEDPNDDLKITDFKIEDGKPVITLNHTKDGSGNSFEPRIKTLGKANLTDADWVDVTDKDQSAYRFFKVTVDLP